MSSGLPPVPSPAEKPGREGEKESAGSWVQTALNAGLGERLLFGLFEQAKSGKWGRLSLLNQALDFTIPFNWTHKIRILELSDDSIKVGLPYRRSNLNHVSSLHAAALFTVSEFASGILIISNFRPGEMRLLMEGAQVEYLKRAKGSVVATCTLKPSWFEEQIRQPLACNDSVSVKVEVLTHDSDNHAVSRMQFTWQIKPWNKVRSK